tara:strand:+ start:3855 stop:4400 length:546 start_codon:yes stop_codon:yes gene_type:complete
MKYLTPLLFLVLSFPVLGSDQQEYNYKAKHDGWEYTFRHREGGWHAEIGNKIGPVEVMYRYADLVTTRENRIKFTTEFYSYEDLTIEGRIEYRHFDNKESHWRYRFITEYTPHLYGPLHLYVKWQPRWSFKDDGTKFDARDQLGITYKQKTWKITPFIERKSTEGYDRKMTVTGVHAEWKL